MIIIQNWRRKWQPTPVLLPGKSRGWRSLVGYSPWGRKESDTTERLTHTHIIRNGTSQVVLVVKNLPAKAGDARDLALTPGSGRSPGRGHGNSLQCSCLENPTDMGAWWATVHGVAKSQTRLK